MTDMTLYDIIALSQTYHKTHGVTGSDVERANALIRVIEETRDKDKPQEGDIIVCEGPKKTYDHGHFEYFWQAKHFTVCTRPSKSFTFLRSENGKPPFPSFSTSGGYWLNVEKEDLDMFEYVKAGIKEFKTWGHCGACGDGAFTFKAQVNIWKLFREDIY